MKQPQKTLSEEERKKIILKSAVKVFARSNYRGAKMADIGAESGVSEAVPIEFIDHHIDQLLDPYIELIKVGF